MTHTLALLLLVLCCITGLVLVPLGLPGLWVMVGGVRAHRALRRIAAVWLGRAGRRGRGRPGRGAGPDRRERDRRLPRRVRGRGAVRVLGVAHRRRGGAGGLGCAAGTRCRRRGEDRAGRGDRGDRWFRGGAGMKILAVSLCAALAACGRATTPADQRAGLPAVRHDEHVFAGGAAPEAVRWENPYRGDKRAAEEGAKIFTAMNCDGCHGGAGVGWVGPSLADGRWRVGGADGAIFQSIYYGRPD